MRRRHRMGCACRQAGAGRRGLLGRRAAFDRRGGARSCRNVPGALWKSHPPGAGWAGQTLDAALQHVRPHAEAAGRAHGGLPLAVRRSPGAAGAGTFGPAWAGVSAGVSCVPESAGPMAAVWRPGVNRRRRQGGRFPKGRARLKNPALRHVQAPGRAERGRDLDAGRSQDLTVAWARRAALPEEGGQRAFGGPQRPRQESWQLAVQIRKDFGARGRIVRRPSTLRDGYPEVEAGQAPTALRARIKCGQGVA